MKAGKGTFSISGDHSDRTSMSEKCNQDWDVFWIRNENSHQIFGSSAHTLAHIQVIHLNPG